MIPEEEVETNDVGNRAIDILKSISVVDMENFTTETREDLAILFNELIMMEEEEATEFIERFLNGTKDVIRDMGLMSDDERETTDEVDMSTDDTEEVADDTEEVADDTEAPKESGDDIPDDLFDNYNRMINTANSYIY